MAAGTERSGSSEVPKVAESCVWVVIEEAADLSSLMHVVESSLQLRLCAPEESGISAFIQKPHSMTNVKISTFSEHLIVSTDNGTYSYVTT